MSQIPVLDRAALCPPVLPVTPAPMTRGYLRNGTTSLSAARDAGGDRGRATDYSERMELCLSRKPEVRP